MGRKPFLCPCCKEYVFPEGPGSYQVCPICNWEDDKFQWKDPEMTGGANRLSLYQSREAYTSAMTIQGEEGQES